MQIREVRSSDLDSLVILFDCYRVFYKNSSDIKAAKNFIEERINNNDSKIYICELEDEKIVGFVQLYPLFSSTRMKKLYLLNDLFVNPDYRGQGYSVKLIERAKSLVIESSACAMFLETEKSNMIGNNLYPKMGFDLNEGSNFYQWNS
jgi:GNAT superfamily N-acetyltransferase